MPAPLRRPLEPAEKPESVNGGALLGSRGARPTELLVGAGPFDDAANVYVVVEVGAEEKSELAARLALARVEEERAGAEAVLRAPLVPDESEADRSAALDPAPDRGREGVVPATRGVGAKRCLSNMSFQVCSSWKRVYQYRETCDARASVLGSSTWRQWVPFRVRR